MIALFQAVVVWACAAALIAIASVVIIAGMGKAAERAKRRLRGASLVMLVLAAFCTIFGRKGSVMQEYESLELAGREGVGQPQGGGRDAGLAAGIAELGGETFDSIQRRRLEGRVALEGDAGHPQRPLVQLGAHRPGNDLFERVRARA